MMMITAASQTLRIRLRRPEKSHELARPNELAGVGAARSAGSLSSSPMATIGIEGGFGFGFEIREYFEAAIHGELANCRTQMRYCCPSCCCCCYFCFIQAASVFISKLLAPQRPALVGRSRGFGCSINQTLRFPEPASDTSRLKVAINGSSSSSSKIDCCQVCFFGSLSARLGRAR